MHKFRTIQDALDAGYTPVRRGRHGDRDTSGHNSFGYSYENEAGEQTVTVWLEEELNRLGQPGAFEPMYPPTTV